MITQPAHITPTGPSAVENSITAHIMPTGPAGPSAVESIS